VESSYEYGNEPSACMKCWDPSQLVASRVVLISIELVS
jgi:hypothetical protein